MFVGPMEINDHLQKGKRLFTNEIVGPEAFAMDLDSKFIECYVYITCILQ